MPRRRLLTQPLQPSLLLQLPTRRSPPKSRDREYITRRTSPGRAGVSSIPTHRVTARVVRVTTYLIRIFRADMLASGKAQVLPPPYGSLLRKLVHSFWCVHDIQTTNFSTDHCAITCQSDTGGRPHLQGICKSIRYLEARLCVWDLSVYGCRRTARRRAPLPS